MFLATPSAHKNELDDLLWEITRSMSLLFVIGAGILDWIIIIESKFNSATFWVTSVLMVCDIIIYQHGMDSRRVARYAFIWSTTVWLLAIMIINQDIWLIFLGLPTIMASLVLLSIDGAFNSALIFFTVLILTLSGKRDYPVTGFAAFSFFTGVLSWVTVETIYVTLHWTKLNEQRANALLEETRESREETLQALKSLEKTNAALRRTQIELRVAHREAEKARQLKEQFAANISHELRTPLNLILGFTEVMHLTPDVYDGVNWSPTLKGDIYQIYRSSRHLLEMIDDILDLSRFQMSAFKLNRELTPVRLILEEGVDIAKDLFRKRGVELQVDLADALPRVEVDRTRIRQVILNLINNAYRFTDIGYIRLTAIADDHKVSITVRDTGQGIPPDKLPFIFDEFYQVDSSLSRRHGGTGLGLAISKEFVESHGGEIRVESQIGVGSSFTFTIPRLEDVTPTILQSSEDNTGLLSSEEKPVMVVIDSDPLVATMVQEHMVDCDIIQVDNLAALDGAINECYPDIIIHNVAPNLNGKNDEVLPLLVPWIECSLPSRSWILKQLRVADSFVKPVISSELIQAVRKIGPAHNILIIEDDLGFVRLVERMLQTSGDHYTIHSIHTGDNAISQQMQVAIPDLILLDLSLPDLNGIRILEFIQEQSDLANVPVILVSATNYAEDLLAKQGGRIVVRHASRIATSQILDYIQAISSTARTHR